MQQQIVHTTWTHLLLPAYLYEFAPADPTYSLRLGSQGPFEQPVLRIIYGCFLRRRITVDINLQTCASLQLLVF